MKAFIYKAALYCEPCGNEITKRIRSEGQPSVWSGEDSDCFPQGPYGQGGGEADCPQSCDACGLFLRNPLTDDGARYVLTAIEQYRLNGRGNRDVLNMWFDYYGTAHAGIQTAGIAAGLCASL